MLFFISYHLLKFRKQKSPYKPQIMKKIKEKISLYRPFALFHNQKFSYGRQ